MIICGTGHRPNKLGGYSDEAFAVLAKAARGWLKENKPTLVISGMALGWDQALAVAAIRLKIPVHAYVPCKNHPSRWPQSSQVLYAKILSRCEKVVMVTDGEYNHSCMNDRNKAMVDASDLILAVWDGTKGGTGNCVDYAEKKGVKVENIYNNYIKIAKKL